MLQNLLAERLKLTLHRGTKIVPLYELNVAKNGPKLTVSKGNAPPPGSGPPRLPPNRKSVSTRTASQSCLKVSGMLKEL